MATQAECAWTAASDVSWITGLEPGFGPGRRRGPLPGRGQSCHSARQGRITLNGVAAQVNQAGLSCRVNLSAVAIGGSVRRQRHRTSDAPGGCAWTASTQRAVADDYFRRQRHGQWHREFHRRRQYRRRAPGRPDDCRSDLCVTQAAPGAPQCNYAIQQSSVNVPVSGGTTVVNVQADRRMFVGGGEQRRVARRGRRSVWAPATAVSRSCVANTGAARNGCR